MKKAIAFVPVRCGSKSIKLKNIKLFCGRPLVWWVLAALEESRTVGKIYVATDCDEIANVVTNMQFSRVAIYRRSLENSQDTSSTEDAIFEFLANNPLPEDVPFYLVQATSPFTTSEQLDDAFDLFIESKADSLLTCTRIKKFLWSEDGIPLNYDYRFRPRRQDFSGVLVENGAFYITTVGAVLRAKNRLSGKIAVFEMDDERTSYELDEEIDWIICEALMRERQK
ncbi:acylneuraminate cytidylyltransferase family protein [Desulforhopalus singaporensis]|uniref:CMP-N-acetylneuraminic acid synthetase n=1 Tax=Desulforhopalus singaporensis TaxID=91360 RepID=A0A1H0QQH9_9BACT|nr:acylneuraminate cytidylyltransferase family protein [Desulforhopalus singaporensis]SDP19603.1 CMP-N-acetylneuraminic acid synthetase [Desulforhopalus singaporensis]